jgi:hypothetical protein
VARWLVCCCWARANRVLAYAACVIFALYWAVVPGGVVGYVGALYGRRTLGRIWGLATLIVMGIGPFLGTFMGGACGIPLVPTGIPCCLPWVPSSYRVYLPPPFLVRCQRHRLRQLLEASVPPVQSTPSGRPVAAWPLDRAPGARQATRAIRFPTGIRGQPRHLMPCCQVLYRLVPCRFRVERHWPVWLSLPGQAHSAAVRCV